MYHYLNNPRFQWFFDTPNQCAAVLAMFAIITAGFFLFFSTKIRQNNRAGYHKGFLFLSALSLGSCIFLEYLLVITYSRGGYIALFFSFLLMFFITGRKRTLWLPLISFILLLVVPCGADRVSGIANIADTSIGNRLELWKGALAMSADYWQSGVGFGFGGPFLKIFSAWYQPLWMNTFYNTAVCDYFSLSTKGGIFLLFGYLALTSTILFFGYRLHRKNRNLLLAGLLCAQMAYLSAGIFSTFFNVYYVVVPFWCMQLLTVFLVLIYIIKQKEFSYLKKAYIPFLAAGGACVLLLISGGYFRSQIKTRYEMIDYKGLKLTVVTPVNKDADGIILYLFDSEMKSLEEEARLTLRPLAEKGFTVISAETEGGFKGLEQAKLIAEMSIKRGRQQGIPVMFLGQGEGGRFAIICAVTEIAKLNKESNSDSSRKIQVLKGVATIGTSSSWPFPGLSPERKIKDCSVPLFVIHGDEDNATPIHEVQSFITLANKHGKSIKSLIFQDAPHYLGEKREDALDAVSAFFFSNLSEASQQKIMKSRIDYIDYANATQKDISEANGWIFGGRICPRCDYLKAELIPELINVGHASSLTNKRDKQDACPTLKKEDKQDACPTLKKKNNRDGCPTFICVDLNNPENIMLLMKLEDRLGVTGQKTPVLLFNSKLYYGNDAVADFIAYGEKNISGNDSVMDVLTGEDNLDESEILKKRAAGFQLPLIVTAGLVDGINPCVFSTLIFFMSLLGVSKIRGKKLLLTGFSYCSACFLTYFLLGFGALHILKLFTGFSFLRVMINSVTVFLLLLCALVSFRDSWVFSRSQDPEKIKLQLPNSVKNKIHRVFRKGLSFRYLIPGTLLTGFIVTLLESLCTGQVYVPILVLLARENFMSKWFFYLIVYNIMFILPLIVIFCMAFFGVTVSGFLKLSKQNVVLSKLLLGCLFLALSVLIIALG